MNIDKRGICYQNVCLYVHLSVNPGSVCPGKCVDSLSPRTAPPPPRQEYITGWDIG